MLAERQHDRVVVGGQQGDVLVEAIGVLVGGLDRAHARARQLLVDQVAQGGVVELHRTRSTSGVGTS
jgi:hypothetical protein